MPFRSNVCRVTLTNGGRCVDNFTNGNIFESELDAAGIAADAVETRLRRDDEYYTRVLYSLSEAMCVYHKAHAP